MPRSCNLLFDLLSVRGRDGPVEAGLVELARATRLSLAQVHRALKRLEGARLITWTRARGRGGRSRITLRWVIHRPEGSDGKKRRPELDGAKFSSHARDTLSSSGKNKRSPTGRWAGDLPLGDRALAWAMAQVREDLRGRPSIDPQRRAVVTAALGPAVHRALRRGEVRTRRELRELVAFILARIDERRGLGEDLAATRRWAEWAVRGGLRRVAETRAEREASRRFIAELRRDAEEARRAWADPTMAAQVRRMIASSLKAPAHERGSFQASHQPDLSGRKCPPPREPYFFPLPPVPGQREGIFGPLKWERRRTVEKSPSTIAAVLKASPEGTIDGHSTHGPRRHPSLSERARGPGRKIPRPGGRPPPHRSTVSRVTINSLT